MDQVLCIDLSSEPARIALVSVEQKKLTVVQSEQFSLKDELDLEQLTQLTLTERSTNGEQQEEPLTDQESGEPSPEPQRRAAWPIPSLVEAVARFPSTWTNSVMVVPMHEYLSLNLVLPFGDAKNVSKILDLEVQDVVPFEVDEFAIEGHSLCALAPNQFDIHVSLAPKRFVANLLQLCRASGLDPSIVTTPCSSLAALPHLAPEYFRDTYALISITPEGVYVCASIDGRIRSDKIITPKSDSSTDPSWFLSELKLALMGMEKKYSRTFANVYVNAGRKVVAELQQMLGRTVEPLELSDFVSTEDKFAAAAALPALFADNETGAVPLSNFRVREFSFRPNWGALLRALASIKYYLLGVVALSLLSVFITYEIRQLQISRLEAAVRDQIQQTIPSLKVSEGSELTGFKTALEQLSKELESIGSSNEISPINILVELTKDFSGLSNVAINEIDIRPDRILLEVSAPDYAAADRIEKTLSRKREIYRRIRRDDSSYASSSGGRNFNFEIKLHD